MWYGRECLNIIGSLFYIEYYVDNSAVRVRRRTITQCIVELLCSICEGRRREERSVREGKSIWWVGNLKWGWPWRSSGWVVGLCRTDHSLLARERWQVYNYYRTCCPALQPPCPPPNSADVLQHCGTHFLHSSRQHLCNKAFLQLC